MNGEWLMGTGFLLGWWKCTKIRLRSWMHNSVIILKAIQYILYIGEFNNIIICQSRVLKDHSFLYSKLWMYSIVFIHFYISFRLIMWSLWKTKMKTIFIPQKAVRSHPKKAKVCHFKHLETSSSWWGQTRLLGSKHKGAQKWWCPDLSSVCILWQVDQMHQWVS